MLYSINRVSIDGKNASGSDSVGELMALEMIINGMKEGDIITIRPVVEEPKPDTSETI